MSRKFALLFIASLCFSAGALAQSGRGAEAYPNKTVRLLVGLAPGGNPDTFARLTAKALSDSFGQPFVVENRPGAGSNLAADAVAKSTPDGHTLLIGGVGIFTINPHIYKNMPFDPIRDLTPVTLSVATTMWLVVHPSVAARTTAELIALAKSLPKPLAYASAGNGSIHHITMEEFKAKAGVDFTHIPFKGAGQAVPAMLTGEVPIAFIGYPTIGQAVKAGRLRVLAFSMARRSSLTPEVPTVGESGLPGFDMSGATGVFVAAGTPRPIIIKLSQAFNDAIRLPDVAQRLTSIGLETIGSTPEEFEKRIRSETEHDALMVKRLGLRGE
ncbi:MAG: tripartite tricarboxylate transporter substrate binding protein [Betaproteobacteria bacterium]|nr:tripartite tricarboxylate transporter substrate binding protein [Betaproteobacteria bacterium]